MGITKGLNLFLDTKYLLKSIYRSFSKLRLIIEAKTNVDFRCMSCKTWKSSCFGKQLNFSSPCYNYHFQLVFQCRLIIALKQNFEKYYCATIQRCFLDRVSHCSSVLLFWPPFLTASRKIPASSLPLKLTEIRALWWTTTVVWRKAKVKCWPISKLKLIPLLQIPAKVFIYKC